MNNQAGDKPTINALFQNLRPRSKHSVATAIEAISREGLTGTLIINIPSSVEKPAEAFFTNADLRLVPAIGLQ